MANTHPLFAGIDLGSNSFRILIAGIDQGKIIPLYKGLDTVRLGRHLTSTGLIGSEAMHRAFQVMANYRGILQKHRPLTIRACGTAALRQAGNRNFFLKQASEILGVQIEVINGDEEALLAMSGALSQLPDLADTPVLLVDIGGGSTELIYKNDRIPDKYTTSMPLGAVNLTETFLHHPLPLSSEIAAMEGHVISLLSPWIYKLDLSLSNQPPVIIATGGTATALAALSLNLSSYNEALIQGYVLSLSDLDNTITMLQNTESAARNNLPGLDCGRGEIILGGAVILHTILKLCRAKSLTVSDAGLLEGILLSAVQATQKGIP